MAQREVIMVGHENGQPVKSNRVFTDHFGSLGVPSEYIDVGEGHVEDLVAARKVLREKIRQAKSKRKSVYLMGEDVGALLVLLETVSSPSKIDRCGAVFTQDGQEDFSIPSESEISELVDNHLKNGTALKRGTSRELETYRGVFSLDWKTRFKIWTKRRRLSHKIRVFIGTDRGFPLKIAGRLIEQTELTSVIQTVPDLDPTSTPDNHLQGYQFIARFMNANYGARKPFSNS